MTQFVKVEPGPTPCTLPPTSSKRATLQLRDVQAWKGPSKEADLNAARCSANAQALRCLADIQGTCAAGDRAGAPSTEAGQAQPELSVTLLSHFTLHLPVPSCSRPLTRDTPEPLKTVFRSISPYWSPYKPLLKNTEGLGVFVHLGRI